MPVRANVAQLVVKIRHPRTTVRGRLTLLYGGLFLASGAALLAITYFLVERTFPAVSDRGFSGGVSASIAGGFHGTNGPPSPFVSKSTAATLDNQIRNADFHHLLVESIIALIIMAMISVALGWLVAGRVLRPLRMITDTTRRISEDNLHERLAMSGPRDELKDLSDTIDGLLARLEGAFDAQRRFVANASHELRTPLTVARTLLEMILGDPDPTIESFRVICQDVLEAGEQQEQLIEALLTLARSQRGLDHRQDLDLAVIVTKVHDASKSEAAARDLRLDVSVRPTPLMGDPQLIERLASNLVQNALHYNVPGGSVQVRVDTGAESAYLQVTNTGPFVAVDQISRLLQPFQRVAGDRMADKPERLGLGLSIVQAIAIAHEADLTVHPGDAGGLNVEVQFHSSADRSAPALRNGKVPTLQPPIVSS